MDIREILIITPIYFILSFACVILTALKREKIRKAIKCLPVFSLLLFTLIKDPTNRLPYIIFLAGVLGDALLIPKRKSTFLLGIFCFFLEHVFMFSFVLKTFITKSINYSYYIFIFAAPLLFDLLLFLFLKIAQKDII